MTLSSGLQPIEIADIAAVLGWAILRLASIVIPGPAPGDELTMLQICE